MIIPEHMKNCRVYGGLPVPQVVSTRKGHHELGPTTEHGFTHKTAWVPEDDVPDFGKYDDDKLRRCIRDRVCHVCWRSPADLVLDGRLILCLPNRRSPEEGQNIEVNGRLVPLVIQPWVCVPCLMFACSHCPPLRQAIAERRGLVAFPQEVRLVLTHWKPAEPEDPIPPPGARVLSLLKIAIVRARYMPLHEWAERRTV